MRLLAAFTIAAKRLATGLAPALHRAGLRHSDAGSEQPGLGAQLVLHQGDVPRLPGVGPRVRVIPAPDAVPGLALAVSGVAPQAARAVGIVVEEADRGRLVVDRKRCRLPAQRLGSGSQLAVGTPPDLT